MTGKVIDGCLLCSSIGVLSLTQVLPRLDCWVVQNAVATAACKRTYCKCNHVPFCDSEHMVGLCERYACVRFALHSLQWQASHFQHTTHNYAHVFIWLYPLHLMCVDWRTQQRRRLMNPTAYQQPDDAKAISVMCTYDQLLCIMMDLTVCEAAGNPDGADGVQTVCILQARRPNILSGWLTRRGIMRIKHISSLILLHHLLVMLRLLVRSFDEFHVLHVVYTCFIVCAVIMV